MVGRGAGAAALAVIVAVLVSGCGDAKEAVKPAVVISAAADKTATGTARISSTTALEGAGHRAEIQRMTGEQSFADKSSSLEMRTPLSEMDPTRDDIVIDASVADGVT